MVCSGRKIPYYTLSKNLFQFQNISFYLFTTYIVGKFPEFFLQKFSRKKPIIFPEISGKIPQKIPEISQLTTLVSTNIQHS